MGNCIAGKRRTHGGYDAFMPTNVNGEADGQRLPGRGMGKKGRGTLQSMIRVGSLVFKAEPFGTHAGSRSPDETTQGDIDNATEKRTKLEQHKASTYDHVHQIVNIGIECYHRNSSSGKDECATENAKQLSGKVGLINMGNTCFMNSSLQCLSNTIPLTDYFLGYDYRSEINHENFLGTRGALSTSFAELIKHLWLGSERCYRPEDFKTKLEQFAPQFRGYEQQDAHELLAFLLDGIHEDLNRVKKRPYIEEKDCDGTNDEGDSILAWSNYLLRNRSIIVDMFQGQLRNTMTCRNRAKVSTDGTFGCGHCNVKFDPFMYLSLPISSNCRTLDDCLQLYCEEELLDGDEKWYCPKCESHVEATKKIDLWMLPPILIIHLKRFKFSSTGQRSKIDTPIGYSLNDWDLSNLKKSSGGSYPLYELYAVSHHRGNVGFGHYTAHAKNRFDGKWYDFNDSHVIDAFKENLGYDPSAYCLFYNRVERISNANGDVRTNTIIRRQSTNRPELWPHLQRSKVNEWKSVRSDNFVWKEGDDQGS
eukprot:CCRYP_011069-RA/>CCRYP_011069-RA protein AED:0.07 eAED:0.07 QI:74/1/1/1/1/1/2/2088/533